MSRNLTVECRRMVPPMLAAVIAAIGLLIALCGAASAQERFQTPEAAVDALVAAAKAADANALLRVLGPDGRDIISSGDPVDDANTRKRFVEAYDAKHQISKEGDDKVILELGQDDWPFPIPVVRQDGSWRFDTAAGREELLFRRIGRNELNVIQAMLAYVDAQQEYAEKGYGGPGFAAYAQRIVSRPGKKDGLYWPTAAGEEESPLGDLMAAANAQGYRARGGGERTPFHGYYYKILTRQGPAAQGGVLDYVVKGKMIGGFGLVAWPAEYGNSGVMTFIVNHNGTVYEKDLGQRTAQVAAGMTAYNPDDTWKKVDVSGQ